MKKTLAVMFAGLAAILFAEVKIDHKQTVKGPAENNTYKVLNASEVRYVINYNIRTKDGIQTVGDRTSASTGIGLNNGWYSSGSIRIQPDGKNLTTPAKREIDGDLLTFTWENATLKMKFPEGSDKIYCEVSAPNARKLKIGFLVMPGFVSKRKEDFKPYVSTEKVNHLLTDGKYSSAGESWFMLYDGVINRNGIPAVLLDPAEVKSGAVTGGAKAPVMSAQFEMNKTVCRFILMGYPNSHMDAESFYEDLKANGGKYLNELKSLKF